MKKILSILFVLVALSVDAATYYVSPTGSSGNPGTYASPWSVAKANSDVVAGDTIVFKNGTYTGGISISNSGTIGNYITWTVESVGGVILDGQSNTTAIGFAISGKSYLNIIGFEITGYANQGIVANGSSNINFSQLHIHHIGRRCTDTTEGLDAYYFSGSSYITIERNLIHDIGRYANDENGCTNTTDNYKAHDHGVYCAGNSNLIIKNNVFYNISRGYSLQIYSGTSSNIQFINNTCENGNPFDSTGHVILAGNCSNTLIANNIFKDHYQYALRVFQSSYTYSGVTITKNISYGGNGIFSAGTATGVTISNNTITNPIFTDEASHVYILQSNSPAINAGYATGLTTDYLNNSRDASIDIGAYEYIPETPSTTVKKPIVINGKALIRNGKIVTY